MGRIVIASLKRYINVIICGRVLEIHLMFMNLEALSEYLEDWPVYLEALPDLLYKHYIKLHRYNAHTSLYR